MKRQLTVSAPTPGKTSGVAFNSKGDIISTGEFNAQLTIGSTVLEIIPGSDETAYLVSVTNDGQTTNYAVVGCSMRVRPHCVWMAH